MNPKEQALHKEPNRKGIILKTEMNPKKQALHKEPNRKEIILKTEMNLKGQVLHKERNREMIILLQEIHLPEIIIILRETTAIEGLENYNTQSKTRFIQPCFFIIKFLYIKINTIFKKSKLAKFFI
jgi:hypothetical protein